MTAPLLRFGPELHAQLKQEAARDGVSVAQYIRDAVSEYIVVVRLRRHDQRFTADDTYRCAGDRRRRPRVRPGEPPAAAGARPRGGRR